MKNQEKVQIDYLEENQIYQIYDRIFKRIFMLSNLAIVNLVNALFHANHPPDSKIIYLNKEFVSHSLSKRFADMFLQINGMVYHLEAQMTKQKNIVLRVFEYGFYHAMETQEDGDVLRFPEPVIIYLDTEGNIPPFSTLLLNFGGQGSFEYKVENFVYQEHELRELNQKKMVILIPFQLLKLKGLMNKEPTKENFGLLQNLVLHDILGSIKANLEVGNITESDAGELKELTLTLFQHICRHYEALGGSQDMKEFIEGAMELPLDKYRIRIDELEGEKAKAEKEKVKAEKEKAKAEEEKAAMAQEIQGLKEELERLKSR